MPSVFAAGVSNSGLFELDGDAVNDSGVSGEDWDNICKAVTITRDPTSSSLPSGLIPDQCGTAGATTATAVSWTAELDPSASIFTGGGSKDPEDISAWAWKNAGGLPDKDNLLHSFAARYTGTSDYLFFGSDRFDNSGDAQQGFWFLQNKVTLSNVKSGGGFLFAGDKDDDGLLHRPGDLLIISNFSNGGTTSTISVYTWDPTVAGNLRLEESSTSAKCSSASTLDFCGIVNESTSLSTSPWTFLDKSGNTAFAQGEFYEGGVNLTALGLDDECFSSAISETRSSTSTTATLKDFVLGQFANCTATMTTTASTNGSVIPGSPVTDTATIDGSSTIAPTGTVTFYLCAVSPGGSCTTGGTLVGTGTLSPDSQLGNASATSPQVNTSGSPLAAGHYCFRAEWPGDSNYTTALTHTNSTTECFDVKDTSSITTAQEWLPQDTAAVTLASGATASGSVLFRLYNNGTCSGTAAATFTDPAAPFRTDNTTYRTVSATISWSATFTPSDTNAVVGSTTTRCERSDLTINNSASDFPPAP